MRWITLGTSISIAGVAAWYSIAGLMAIFSGSAIPVAVMGGVLEVGKLITAAWLHNNWKTAPWLIRSYLTFAVVILMAITSLGIFGFLSKAHLEHSVSAGGTNELLVSGLERKIERQQSIIDDSETVLAQLDSAVQILQEYDRIRGPDGALAVRKAQTEEREELNRTIGLAYDQITRLQEQLLPLQQQTLQLEVEVGPLKYIAELIYGKEDAENNFDKAVRFAILLLVLVFDPLAVVLVIVTSKEFKRNKSSKVFYEDGNLKVAPSNVVEIEDPLPEFFETEEEVEVVLDIPEDEDISEYEVASENIEEQEKPKIKKRKHEDGWYSQAGTPNI